MLCVTGQITYHRNNVVGNKLVNNFMIVSQTSGADIVGIAGWQNTRPADGESVVSQLENYNFKYKHCRIEKILINYY